MNANLNQLTGIALAVFANSDILLSSIRNFRHPIDTCGHLFVASRHFYLMMSPFGVIFSDPWCHQLMLSATVPSDPCR